MVSERRILTIIKVNAVYPLLLFCNDNMKKKKKTSVRMGNRTKMI